MKSCSPTPRPADRPSPRGQDFDWILAVDWGGPFAKRRVWLANVKLRRLPADWSHARPFIAVPKGKGALTAFWAKAGGRPLRAVDASTRATSLFIVSGIPGTVGSGTKALWEELVPLLAARRDFSVWPFEGSFAALAAAKICLAEIYPRACYAIALDDSLPAPPRDVSKTRVESRAAAAKALLASAWVRRWKVFLDASDLATADGSEDDFDAMISAAALLRCVLEKRSLERPGPSIIEGDMLVTGLLGPGRATFEGRQRGCSRRGHSSGEVRRYRAREGGAHELLVPHSRLREGLRRLARRLGRSRWRGPTPPGLARWRGRPGQPKGSVPQRLPLLVSRLRRRNTTRRLSRPSRESS